MSERHGTITRRTLMKGAALAALGSGCAALRVASPSAPPPLAYRVLGRTGLKVTQLSCGAVEEHVVCAALDAGINYFDTAPCYPAGRNEEALGAALRRRGGRRDTVILATKFNRKHFHQIRPTPPKTYVESVEQSLKRLGTDYVDIVLQHGAEFEDMNNEDVLDAFRKLKKAGKARFLGAANHSHQSAYAVGAALQTDDYDMFMLTYNPFDVAKGSEAILREAKEKNIGVIVMKSVMLLKGAIHRRQNPQFRAEMERRAKERGRGLNLYQTSIAWALANDAAASVCVGCKNAGEIREDVIASGITLGAAERSEFRTQARVLAGYICDWCGACLGSCPCSIAIPDIARFTLYYEVAGEPDRAREEYAGLHPRQRASNCSGCGNCERACPKRLPVRRMLREAEALLA